VFYDTFFCFSNVAFSVYLSSLVECYMNRNKMSYLRPIKTTFDL